MDTPDRPPTACRPAGLRSLSPRPARARGPGVVSARHLLAGPHAPDIGRSRSAPVAAPAVAAPLVLAALALASACAGPPSHATRLWPEGTTDEPFHGLSTEDGVVILAEPHFAVGDVFEIQFPFGNSTVRDWGRLDRRNDDLAVVQPLTARLLEGRIATRWPAPLETLHLAVRDDDDRIVMRPVERWHEGRHGHWIASPERDARAFAARWAGAGLYVERQGRWEIVGLLAGVTTHPAGDPGDVALGYVGLDELARILPDRVDYAERPTALPQRPDFEHGVPLQPGDVDLDSLLDEP